MKFAIFVRGLPEGQERPRYSSASNAFYSPKSAWYKAVYMHARFQRLSARFTGPLRVDLTFYLPRPKSVPPERVWCDQKPDKDNATKATYDALTAAGWWQDDKIIVDGFEKKLYETPRQRPGCLIEVSQVEEPCPKKVGDLESAPCLLRHGDRPQVRRP